MSAKKIITILGIVIIFVGIGIGAYFVFQKGLISLGSDPEIVPSKVQITNVSNDKFSVSWITTGKSIGSVIYGQNSKLEQIELDDVDQLTGQSKPRKIHHVTINGLQASSTYYFKIRSGENNRKFDKDGEPYSVKTAPILGSQPPSDMISGTVMLADSKPAEGAVVYVDISGVKPLSTYVTKNGDWLISLSNARNLQLTDYASYDAKEALINISIQGEDKVSKVVTNTSNKSPVPEIILGEAYDFTSVKEVGNVGLGEEDFDNTNDVSVEEENTGKPLESFVEQGIKEVTIISPEEGEELDTTKPVFSGEGPADTVINISIVEDDTFSGSKTIDSYDEWEFSFSKPFDPGETYTLLVDYFDEDDEEINLEREFSIALDATEENDSSPSYNESSPSAKPKATPKSTVVPSSTASASASSKGGVRNSMPSTNSGTPVSGMTSPTIVLLLIGVGLITGGYRFKKIN